MKLNHIDKKLIAGKIIKQHKTNSFPLEVLCEDNKLYVAKTMVKKDAPYEDLINEILCKLLMNYWDIPTPQSCLIKINKETIEAAQKEGIDINRKYDLNTIDDKVFYGSMVLKNSTEIDLYNINIKDRYQFKKFLNPLDLIKIGFFDLWIANKDRRVKNPNILLEIINDKQRFVAIDNVQAFAYQRNYKALNLAIMEHYSSRNSILNASISKKIITFADVDLVDLKKELLNCINISVDNIDKIYELIPRSFGLSIKGKEKIKEILSNNERNNIIVNRIPDYLK